MYFEIIQTILFLFISALAFLLYQHSTKGQLLILRTHEEVIKFISSFREEMHKAIKDAISSHIKEYHTK